MVTVIKILILLLGLFLLFFPMLPLRTKGKRFSTIAALKYEKPHFRMNAVFIVVAVVELALFVVLYNTIADLGEMLVSLPIVGRFIADVISKLGSEVSYIAFAVAVMIGNLLMVYLYVILKRVMKLILDSFVYTDQEKQVRKNKKKRKNKNPQEKEEDFSNIIPENVEKDKKKTAIIDDNVPVMKHVRRKDKDGDGDRQLQVEAEEIVAENDREPNLIARAFFESPEYLYAKPWVRRVVTILQCFIFLAEAYFFILFGLIFVAALFPVSNGIYDFLIHIMRVQSWYVYPFLSLIILQEICNTFKTGVKVEAKAEIKNESEEEEIEANNVALRSLASELKRYFDEDHKLRFYPGGDVKDSKFEYQFTNGQYRGALEYIRKKFEGKAEAKGQSYLECMDAMFNEEHVYFCASFYSEIGEYIIAYTYTRLLSGARMIFIVNDRNKRHAIKKYILNRLIQMTGGSMDVTWRVYTSEDRLDQADILVASPEDFKDDNIVENYPDFFEEVCNAVLIDTDKVVSLESYLCPVMAIRLMNATANRIRFLFLTTDLLRGFAASSLPKLFCIDKVLSFSSASDNEQVEYTLWNKESLKNRIYYKNGQKLMSLEGIIAEKAYQYGIDGIRLVTSSSLDHGERQVLIEHNVEINEFYKDVPNINYMIYSDERCNLAAAIYACTRFKGKRNSVAQIISRPYLLREYFMSKAVKENFIQRSSYIQPRITEHAKKEKLSLLKIFCRASANDGMGLTEFVSEMKEVIALSRIRGDVPLCKFCEESPRFADLEKATHKDYAAYLIAALCDTPETELKDSRGNKAKDYYIIVDRVNQDIYSLTQEKYILFRKAREVFEQVFACNERVSLRLNDSNIGYLNTFPARITQEYVVGQSMVYNNVEYEIEQISKNHKILFLRRENVTFKNCLDTVFLRRYKISYSEKIGQDGVLCIAETDKETDATVSRLKEIRVSMQKIAVEGETYGFYNLMSNKQSLNFAQGVEGNPHLEKETIEQNRRILKDGRMLRVTLTANMECNDRMRFLCSAVFNEFIKTMFPMSYRCIAICPVLEEPLEFSAEKEAQSITEKIESLYPYLTKCTEEFSEKVRKFYPNITPITEDVIEKIETLYPELENKTEESFSNHLKDLYPDITYEEDMLIKKIVALYRYQITAAENDFIETDKYRMQFMFINDCEEDVGVFDWFYDKLASNLQELLINVYSYLYWLNSRKDLNHYIYFGLGKLPDCYDLQGACDLFSGYNIIISDNGEKNYETAAVYDEEEERRCSFCHKRMESGRYSFFDEKRTMFICADCMDTVGSKDRLSEIQNKVKKYLENTYPEETFGYGDVVFAADAEPMDTLNEWFFRLDPDKRSIVVCFDLPEKNAEIAILLGMILLWQCDNDLMTEYSNAQLSYEQLKYLRGLGENETADWIENEVDSIRRENLSEIEERIKNHTETNSDVYTSFSALREIGDEMRDLEDYEDYEDIEGEEYFDGLYDPNKTPRFWKRYLLNGALDETAETGTDDDDENNDDSDFDDVDDVPKEENDDDEEDWDELNPNSCIFNPLLPSCPPPSDDDTAITDEDIDNELDDSDDSDEDIDDEVDEVDDSDDEFGDADDSDEDIIDELDDADDLDDELDDKLDDADDSDEDIIDDLDEVDDSDKDIDDEVDEIDDSDEDIDDELDDADDSDKEEIEKKDKKADRKAKKEKRKKKERRVKAGNHGKKGLKIVPYEAEEETNPSIRVYNEIARHAYNYDESYFSREGIDDNRLSQIFSCVRGDYPELFWLYTYEYTVQEVKLKFRCRKPSGELDISQITKKMQELKKSTKTFTHGITKKTDPYQALLTIYKRLILTLDYDDKGLGEGIGSDLSKDDRLRSLHSALVRHKTVCAGYAVAMQYLLQSIGIPCAYVVSEVKGNSSHAFNIVKIGKYCYYLDATWGDRSNTKGGSEFNDVVDYDYCCVPYREFIKTNESVTYNHIPNHKYYPWFKKELKANRHEYYRYRNSYISRYNEDDIVRIFAYCAEHYDAKEDGRFSVSFRCTGMELAKELQDKILNPSNYHRIITKAKRIVAKNKRAVKLLDRPVEYSTLGQAPVVKFWYKTTKK